jgi:amino acid transporter
VISVNTVTGARPLRRILGLGFGLAFTRRAFGDRAGFIVGWIDWLAIVATLAYASVSAVEFVGTLWAPVAQYEGLAAIALLGVFTALHCAGLRIGSTVTSAVRATIGVLPFVLIVGCFLTPARHGLVDKGGRVRRQGTSQAPGSR